MEQLKDRLTSLSEEYELANDSRIKSLEQIDALRRHVSALQQERDAATRNMTKQVRAVFSWQLTGEKLSSWQQVSGNCAS